MKNTTKTPSKIDDPYNQIEFQGINGKRMLFSFDEPELSSDAGLLAVSEFEKTVGLFDRLGLSISEQRSRSQHSLRDLISQRVMQILAGHGDA